MTPDTPRCRANMDGGRRGYQLDELKKTTEELERRLQAVELELPTFRLAARWVIGGAVGILGLVGVAVVALVLR